MLLLIALMGCKKPQTPEVAPPPVEAEEKAPTGESGSANPELPPVKADLKAHMAVHLSVATSARDAVVRGDLEAAKEFMGWLARHEGPEDLPEDWQSYQPYVLAMSQSAKAVSITGSRNLLIRAPLGKVLGRPPLAGTNRKSS